MLTFFVAAAAAFAQNTAATHADVQAQAPRFAIRADPSVAEEVNAVLQAVAHPASTRIPADQDVSAFMRQACGNLMQPAIESVRTTADQPAQVVRHEPCLRYRPSRELKVIEGNTLETLAQSVGLRPNSYGTATVRRSDDHRWIKIDPKRLQIGDVVRFPRAPLWTNITLDTAVVADRPTLVARLAQAVNCQSEAAEECLNRKGVQILSRDPQPASEGTGPELMKGLRGWSYLQESAAIRDGSASVGAMAGGADRLAAYSAAQMAAGPVPTRTFPPVAPSQWPYDANLLSAILSQAPSPGRLVVVGVADAGLANHTGGPLPAAIFARNAGEQRNGEDDDDNYYVDDLHGMGVQRGDDVAATGDLGICPSETVPYATLAQDQRERADHGPMVASIAIGLPLQARAAGSQIFPRLVFFRLLGDLCTPARGSNASEHALEEAARFLLERADVTVISYTYASVTGSSFESAVRNELRRYDKLLVLPAGNLNHGNLDQRRPCPACLGHRESDVFTRTLVVGAATRQLEIAPFSNWGRDTVFLYAPGEAVGAIDFAGADASARSPATSWSAPYAGFAASIMHRLGVTSVRDLRERLLAATWPINDSNGRVDSERSGVLNLMKAAAVRHWAIDVIETAPGGQMERRTYVGRLETPPNNLCAEHPLRPGAVHSVRLGNIDHQGRRQVDVRPRNSNPKNGLFEGRTLTCTMPTRIWFTDLVKGRLEFETNRLTHILLPWGQ